MIAAQVAGRKSNGSEGCYLLRSNIKDWSAEELWHAYIQLTGAEFAFRIQKSDLVIMITRKYYGNA